MGGCAISNFRPYRKSERGAGRFNLLLTLVIIGVMFFAGIKIVPAYVNNYQLQDSMETEARFAGANRLKEPDIRADIWKKVQELGIPAKQDDIKVGGVQGAVEITLDYSVPIDLAVYQFTLNFHLRADNRSI